LEGRKPFFICIIAIIFLNMVFNKEVILSKLPPEIFTIFDSFEYVKYSAEHLRTHNHHYLILQFLETDFFKNEFNKLQTRRPLIEIRDNLFELNSQIIKNQSLEKTILFDILKLLVEHIKDNYYFRWAVWVWGRDKIILKKLEESFNICNQINKYKDDPETGGVTCETRYFWNHEFMPSIWNCVYAGLYDEGFYLIETTENLIEKIWEHKKQYKKLPNNCVFHNILDQNNLGRYVMSLGFAKAQLYLGLKEFKKAEECFENITQLYRGKGNHPKHIIHWPNGYNRITEAAIEVYKLNPTEENKNRAIDYYLSSTYTYDIEPTESTRERLLITYMLMTEVLKIKVL